MSTNPTSSSTDNPSITPLKGPILPLDEKVIKDLSISSLMRAIINDDLTEISEHSKERKFLREKDVFGWTPLHYVALRSSNLFQQFVKQDPQFNPKNNLGGTPQDIRNYVDINVQPISAMQTCYAKGEIKRIASLTPKQLRSELSLETYRDLPYFPPSSHKLLWQYEKSQEEKEADKLFPFFQNYCSKLYMDHCSSPPPLTIAPCTELRHLSLKALELRASKPIKSSTIIGEYGGVIIPEKVEGTLSSILSKPNPYYLPPCDASTIGSGCRFANCGWPNALLIQPIIGGARRLLLLSARPIKEGEPILFDYSMGQLPLSFGTQVLLGKKEMDAFFENGLEPHLQAYETANTSTRQLPNYHHQFLNHQGVLYLAARILFPLQNPSYLIDLHYSKKITVFDWLTYLFKKQEPIKNWINRHPTESWWIYCLLAYIRDFDMQTRGLPSTTQEAIATWIVSQLGKRTIMQILKGMECLLKKIHSFDEDSRKGASASLIFDKTLESILTGLTTYEWTEDPEAPLGLKRSAETIWLAFDMWGSRKREMIERELNMVKEGGCRYKDDLIEKFSYILEKHPKPETDQNSSSFLPVEPKND